MSFKQDTSLAIRLAHQQRLRNSSELEEAPAWNEFLQQVQAVHILEGAMQPHAQRVLRRSLHKPDHVNAAATCSYQPLTMR
jgi:hypothetical protein